MTIINFQYKFVFLANKKCASTVLHEILKSYGGLISDTTIYARPIGKHDNVLEVKAYLKELGYNFQDFKFLTTIRDPIDRIFSSYKYEIIREYLLPNEISLIDYYVKGRYYRHFDDINFFINGLNDKSKLKIIKVDDLENNFVNQIYQILTWLKIPYNNNNNTIDTLKNIKINDTNNIFKNKYPDLYLEFQKIKNNPQIISIIHSRHKHDYDVLF
jgi:hypothetical protein